PRGEERARPRDRSARREAPPRRSRGATACAAAVRDDDAGGVRGADSHLGGRRALLLHPPRPPVRTARGSAHPHSRHPDRRGLAQRGARRDGPAPRPLLPAALRRGPAVVRRSLARLSIPFREPFVTAAGVVTAREL